MRKIDILYFCLYLVIGFVILIPFLRYYIFSLDTVPIINNNRYLDLFYGKGITIYGGYLPLNIVLYIIPISVSQKFIFLFVPLSGYLMFSMMVRILKSKIAGLYAGLFYIINPYVYTMFLDGNRILLISYAILPILLQSFIDILRTHQKKEIIKFTLSLSIVAFNIHILIIALIIMIIVFILYYNKYKDILSIKILLLSGILFGVLNSYWLIPIILSKNTLIYNLSDKDIEVFSPKINGASGWLDIAGMYGFWKDFIYAKDFLQGWQILFIIMLFLSIIGFIYFYKDIRIGYLVKAFAMIGFLGFILASGINGPLSNIIYWLFENTILKGMRDSYKFVSLEVISYSFLGALGILKLKETRYLKRESYEKFLISAILIILFIIPLIYSFPLFNGFAGEIKSTDYPNDWYELNNYLNKDQQDFKVLFLPWHQYMKFNWINNTDKMILNPSQYFYNKDMISGTNIENRLIYREDNSPDQLYIDFLLKNKDNISNFGNLISILNIKYVILAKDADYKRYKFLFNQSDLQLIRETKTIFLFKNMHDVLKIYSVDDIAYIKDWSELLEKSRTENITDRLYILEDTSNNNVSQSTKNYIIYEKKSPVNYNLKYSNRKYIIFTEPYSEYWQLNGDIPLKAYGVTNGYISNGNSKEINFERFYKIYLPSYIISIITFISLIGAYFDLDKFFMRVVKNWR